MQDADLETSCGTGTVALGCGGTQQDTNSGAWEALQSGQIYSVAYSPTLRDPLVALNRADKGLGEAKVVFSKEQQQPHHHQAFRDKK